MSNEVALYTVHDIQASFDIPVRTSGYVCQPNRLQLDIVARI